MKVTLTTSGGFAGISMPPVAKESNDADFKDLAEKVIHIKSSHDGSIPDGITYTLVIQNGSDVKVRQFSDPIPEEVNDLIGKLQ